MQGQFLTGAYEAARFLTLDDPRGYKTMVAAFYKRNIEGSLAAWVCLPFALFCVASGAVCCTCASYAGLLSLLFDSVHWPSLPPCSLDVSAAYRS